MSTIDEKYLGDRVKALEENVTDTIAEGSTAVPTSGAVYNAIQSAGGGIEWIPIPKLSSQDIDADSLVIAMASSNYNTTSPIVYMPTTNLDKYGNNTLVLKGGITVNLWLNMGSWGLTDLNDFYDKISIISIIHSASTTKEPMIIESINMSTGYYTGYIVIKVVGNNGLENLVKFMYTP